MYMVSERYSPGDAELIFGGKTTGIKKLRTIFDSGASYTYLDSHAYGTLTDLVSENLQLTFSNL